MNSHQLILTREFAAPVERLFTAWTNPDLLARWFGPGAITVEEALADAKPGGHYKLSMRDPDGEAHVVFGYYHEVAANERLTFTWQWITQPSVTLVDVRFAGSNNGGSQIELRHSGFTEEKFAEMHTDGWGKCLDKLAPLFTN